MSQAPVAVRQPGGCERVFLIPHICMVDYTVADVVLTADGGRISLQTFEMFIE